MTFSESILQWYDAGHRAFPWRGETNAYRVWVSEIMLQQTRAETVERRYPDFVRQFPTIFALAHADMDEVLKAWEGLGYYARARNLHRAANIIVHEHDGKLPDTAEALRKLPGIGAYAACAIASIAYGEAVPALDANLARVFARVSGRKEALSAPSDMYAYALARISNDRPGDFNQALMDLGATVCVPLSPLCAKCPLSHLCAAFADGAPEDFPAKLPKPLRKEIRRTILIILTPNGVLLRKRPPRGLLGGMWEFPALEDWFSQYDDCLREFAPTSAITSLPDATHVFTHLIWHMRGIAFCSEYTPQGCIPMNAEALSGVAMPSAFRIYRACADELLAK